MDCNRCATDSFWDEVQSIVEEHNEVWAIIEGQDDEHDLPFF